MNIEELVNQFNAILTERNKVIEDLRREIQELKLERDSYAVRNREYRELAEFTVN